MKLARDHKLPNLENMHRAVLIAPFVIASPVIIAGAISTYQCIAHPETLKKLNVHTSKTNVQPLDVANSCLVVDLKNGAATLYTSPSSRSLSNDPTRCSPGNLQPMVETRIPLTVSKNRDVR